MAAFEFQIDIYATGALDESERLRGMYSRIRKKAREIIGAIAAVEDAEENMAGRFELIEAMEKHAAKEDQEQAGAPG